MKLSDFELDVMNVIWRLGECSAPEVHQAIAQEKEVTYSTVKTMIDRLETKGALRRSKNRGRTVMIEACLEPQVVQKSLLNRLVSHVFAGEHRPLFTQLMNDDSLSATDIDFLEGLIKERRERKNAD